MGMYDEFHFMGDASKLVLCGEGHPQRHLQTKSLECNMEYYYVGGPKIVFGPDNAILALAYTEEAVHEESVAVEGFDVMKGVESVKDTKMVLTRKDTYSFAHGLTAIVIAYTTCSDCVPVYYEESNSFRIGVAHQSPWVQYALHFDAGKLTKVEADRVDTRESLRERLTKEHFLVIPDDDRVVQREIELWRQGKNP